MPNSPHIVVIGEALIDVTPSPNGNAEYPGGSPANVALALGRFDREPTLMTQFAEDAHGRILRSWLESSGVNIAVSSPKSERTSTARVEWDSQRNASYTFDIDWDVSDAALAGLPRGNVLHIGSIATVLEPGASALEGYVSAQAQSALVSFDPNVRPHITPDRAATATRIERLFALSDIVKVSDEDLAWLYPGVATERAASALLGSATKAGPIVIALTRGSSDTLLLRGDTKQAIPVPSVEVADTIAAGDTFTAGLLDALLTLGVHGSFARNALLALSDEELRNAASWASTAAAITVTRHGADPPSREELEAGFSSERAEFGSP